ncbi:MAG TPA: hypothetical protein VMS93_02375 [Candidatus Saccharimonadales bacterium]|nr:hypothetical protein [Candidatus Saccharimonadales bacterium]
MPRDPDPRRRWFLQLMALAPALPVLARADRALAQAPAPAPAAPATPPAPAPSPDVAPLTQLLRNRYGKLVSEEELQAFAPDLESLVRVGQRLRGVKLENSVEPDFVFRATPWR